MRLLSQMAVVLSQKEAIGLLRALTRTKTVIRMAISTARHRTIVALAAFDVPVSGGNTINASTVLRGNVLVRILQRQ